MAFESGEKHGSNVPHTSRANAAKPPSHTLTPGAWGRGPAERPLPGRAPHLAQAAPPANGPVTDARSAAARLLQRHARAWLRGRRKLRRKERSRAAKRLQRSVRAWLPSVAVAATPPSPAQSGNEADDQDQTLCVVCLERPRVMLFLACAHLCACEECAPLMMGSCPLCRAEGATLRVYT